MGLYLGNSAVDNIKLGSSQVDRIYLGSDLVWPIPPSPDDFVMEFSMSASETLTIPLFNTTGYNCTIDWGDGSPLSTITTYNDLDLSHTYTLAGTYEVRISGVCKGIYFNNTGDILRLSAIIQWGAVGMITTERAFMGCSNIASLGDFENYPLTSIDDYAFYNCTNIPNLTIPNSVNSIGFASFSGCSSATSLTIPNSITSIGDNAFYNWVSATSLNIPNSITSIGAYTFYGWTIATSLTIPSSVTSIGNFAFYNWISVSVIATCNPTTPPTLGGAATFGFWDATSRIEVPAASLTAYKTATFWIGYADIIFAQ